MTLLDEEYMKFLKEDSMKFLLMQFETLNLIQSRLRKNKNARIPGTTEMNDWAEMVAIVGIATSLVVVVYGLVML